MTRTVVIDASAAAAWVLPDESTEQADRLLSDLLAGRVRVRVPALWLFETVHLLRSAVVRSRLGEDSAREAASLLGALPLIVESAVATQAVTLLNAALSHGLSAYDASYLALAQSYGEELYTQDSDLLRLRAAFPWVRPLSEYASPSTDEYLGIEGPAPPAELPAP